MIIIIKIVFIIQKMNYFSLNIKALLEKSELFEIR